MQTASTRRPMILIIVFILLVVFINRLGFLDSVKNAITRSLSPLLTSSFKISRDTHEMITSLFQTKSALRAENKTLNEELIDNIKLKAEAHRMREENASLQNLLNYASSTPNKVTAQIIGLGTDNTVQSIIIDRGSKNGIKSGDPVIAEGGILVGTVWNTHENEAIVELITDNQSRIGTTILNTNRSIGIATGSHGLSVQIEMIPQNEIITIGDTAVTSGVEKSIPRGLVIGNITTIKKELSEPFQTARLALPLELNKLSWVAVITH